MSAEDPKNAESGGLVRSAEGVLDLGAVDRLAVHTQKLTNHQIMLGAQIRSLDEAAKAALAAQAAKDSARAEFWRVVRTIPAALLALVQHRWAAVIYAVATSVGGLHWLGVSVDSLTRLASELVKLLPGV